MICGAPGKILNIFAAKILTEPIGETSSGKKDGLLTLAKEVL